MRFCSKQETSPGFPKVHPSNMLIAPLAIITLVSTSTKKIFNTPKHTARKRTVIKTPEQLEQWRIFALLRLQHRSSCTRSRRSRERSPGRFWCPKSTPRQCYNTANVSYSKHATAFLNCRGRYLQPVVSCSVCSYFGAGADCLVPEFLDVCQTNKAFPCL